MRWAILCGVLLLAGCDRPTFPAKPKDPAHPESLASPTAGRTQGRHAPAVGTKAAVPNGELGGQDRPPGAEMIPDPVYTPREEDRVTLIADATLAFSRASLFDESDKAPGSGDPDLLRRMMERGEMVELEGRLPVLVLRNLDPADVREPDRHYPVEIQILAGARQGETWFVDESAVTRLVPKVAHPPLAPGSYATVARSGTIVHAGWEAFDPVARPTGDAASRESSRLEEGVRVIVQEVRGEAVRVQVDSGSGTAGRFGVVARSDLRPMVPPSSPVPTQPTGGR